MVSIPSDSSIYNQDARAATACRDYRNAWSSSGEV